MKKIIIMLMLMAPMAIYAQKFAKVNTQTIMNALPEVAKMQGELAALQKQKENDLKSMQDEFQRKAEAYDKTRSTLNPTKQKETETELQNLYQKVQQASQDAQKEIQDKQTELLRPIQQKVLDAINAVGKEGNYSGIMDEAAMIYFGPTIEDVTAKVQAKLK